MAASFVCHQANGAQVETCAPYLIIRNIQHACHYQYDSTIHIHYDTIGLCAFGIFPVPVSLYLRGCGLDDGLLDGDGCAGADILYRRTYLQGVFAGIGYPCHALLVERGEVSQGN